MTLPTEFDHREIGLAVLEALDPNEELTPEELDHEPGASGSSSSTATSSRTRW